MKLNDFLRKNAPLDSKIKIEKLIDLCKTRRVHLDNNVEERILSFTIFNLHPIVKKEIVKLRELLNQKITKKNKAHCYKHSQNTSNT